MVTQIIELLGKYILNFKHYKYHNKGRETGATNNSATAYDYLTRTDSVSECRVTYVLQTF